MEHPLVGVVMETFSVRVSNDNERKKKPEILDFTTELYMQLEEKPLFIQHTGHRTGGQSENLSLAFFIKTSGGVQKFMQPIHRQLQSTAETDPRGIKKELKRRELDTDEGGGKEVEEKDSVQGRSQFRI